MRTKVAGWCGLVVMWVAVAQGQTAGKPLPAPAVNAPVSPAVNAPASPAATSGTVKPAAGAVVKPAAKPRLPWTETYRRATVSFGRIIDVDGKKAFDPVGTGVIVCTDDNRPFIVTAKHVFYEPDKGWVPMELNVRFSYQEKQTLTEQLGIPLPLADAKKESKWSALDDGSDIAAIPVLKSMLLEEVNCITLKDFATEDEVYDGATVFTFGFPNNSSILTGPNGLVRALTRSGIIAWTDPNGALENPLVLDTNVFPGNSGGPAFKVPAGLNKYGQLVIAGRVAFLGIVSAGLQGVVEVGDQPLKVQMSGDATSAAGVIGVGSLGLVEPAAKVKRLLVSMTTKK